MIKNLQIGAPLNSEVTPRLQWVEVASTFQIPNFQIIGLPGPEVAEAKERVRAAIDASGFQFPKRRVILNLSPASVRKQGTGIDLAMALAVLNSMKKPKAEAPLLRVIAWGELGLDGTIKSSGQVTRTLYASCRAGVDYVLIPKIDHAQAVLKFNALNSSTIRSIFSPKGPEIFAVNTLQEAWFLIEALASGTPPVSAEISPMEIDARILKQPSDSGLLPISPALERTLGIAASGLHHLIILGPKGTGKSHALEWLVAIQPPPSDEALLTQALLREMNHHDPFTGDQATVRRVGAQARPGALIGSANALSIRPGEFSLAHGGLLIADEFPEWARDSRESLREPLERGLVTLSRTKGSVELPARFTLAANGNLCPCGGRLDNPSQDIKLRCTCRTSIRRDYIARLSGPILDRIDLIVLSSSADSERTHAGLNKRTPTQIREQVMQTHETLIRLWGRPSGLLDGREIENILRDNPSWNSHLIRAKTESLRSRHKVIRIALSLAAWEASAVPDTSPLPGVSHILEAALYRSDRCF